jgi:hypothetical protein
MDLSDSLGGMGFVPQPNLPLLFSTLPTSIQNALKTKKDSGLTSSLFSDLDITSSAEIVGSFPDKSIMINGVVVKSAPSLSMTEASTSCEVSIPQVGASQNYPYQSNISQVGSSQVGSSQVGSDQSTINDFGISQIGFSQIDSTPDTSTKVDFSQVNLTKVSFSNSITTLQFFNIHNTFSTSIYDINNTSLTLWNTSLQSIRPLNLTIEITDLPAGQLAEANITGFDPTGRPNSGTLYLDTDANGLGWFIDTTPWDNTEYSQTLTTTAYRATADSLAYGHYDLLTTLLHETAHLQSFIAGYSNFDNHIQTINGSKTFVGDGFSAILTPDVSHLSFQVYTYDLMNTLFNETSYL